MREPKRRIFNGSSTLALLQLSLDAIIYMEIDGWIILRKVELRTKYQI
jgi:hypothetical protein